MPGTEEPVHPVAPLARTTLRPLGIGQVRLAGGLLSRLQELNRAAIIPHCDAWMERVGWIENFRAAGRGTLASERRGRLFTDADVYKTMEAMAYESRRRASPAFESRVAELSTLIAEAQAPDGYLNTFFGYPGGPARYSDFEFGHEIFCVGSLLHAAVAWMRTGHDDTLVRIARRAADHLLAEFGPDGTPAIDGHPGTESALVELYRATGERRYLELASLLVERRGHEWLAETRYGGRDYFQDAVPVREATTLVGHAVRALYLAAGAVDVAIETQDAELLSAVRRQFDHVLSRRTYLTGGMGSNHHGESFGEDFELPAERAYAETCAGVASIQLAWRLLLATGEPAYGDVIERTLYNVVAACPAEDGRTFHYVNTLHRRSTSIPPRPDDERLPRTDGMRAPWFTTSCCPTNIARLLASLEGYVATTSTEGLQIHQYAAGAVQADLSVGRVALRVETAYPADGTVILRIEETPTEPWSLTLRIPHWADRSRLVVDGARSSPAPGAVRVERVWSVGDEVVLDLAVAPRFTWPDARIDAVRDCVAVEVGPLVYAVESVDNPEVDLDRLLIDVYQDLTVSEPATADELYPVVEAIGALRAGGALSWPFSPEPPDRAPERGHRVRYIPYYRWANRGPSTMRVWAPATAP